MTRDRALCWLSAQEVGWGVAGGWALLCHTNTMLEEFKIYKTSKFLLQYCHAIYSTCWHDWDNNVKFLKSFHVQSGSVRVRIGSGRRFHTSPSSCIPGKVTQIFNPSALRQGSRVRHPQLESMIRRRFNSSASAVFDQTSYLGVTSHFTKLTRLKQKALSEFIFVTCLFNYCTCKATVIFIIGIDIQCFDTDQTWQSGMKCYRLQCAGQI